jgi:carbon monoxide dehydrogenase subunit G
MRVAGERTFAAPREAVWEVLNDPASMAKTMPGVQSFDIQDERRWRAYVTVPLSLGGLKLSVDMHKTEEREPEFAKLDIKGNGVGAILSMTTSFNLSDANGGTKMDWEADVRIAGPVGSMGQRVLQPIVNQQVQHVLTALDHQVEERQRAGAAAGVGAPSTAPPSPGTTSEETSEPGDAAGSSSGTLGTTPPSTDAEAPSASELKDYGPPAETSPEPEPPVGTSGADEGIAPWAPESYERKPEGPTTSTED